jgi:hypothetical protein
VLTQSLVKSSGGSLSPSMDISPSMDTASGVEDAERARERGLKRGVPLDLIGCSLLLPFAINQELVLMLVFLKHPTVEWSKTGAG